MAALDIRTLFVASALAAVVLLAWSMGLTSSHHWGDDWAGYLLQAKSIVSGDVDRELATNTIAMQGGDSQLGPYAYPWGYPLLLAVAGAITGWSTVGLKSIGAISLAVLIVSTFVLARFRLGIGLAALAAIAVGLQPQVVADANYLGSDVPFAAVSTLGLVLVYAQYDRVWGDRGLSAGLALGVSLLGALAFSIRSNGAMLPCTYVALLGLSALSGRQAWRSVLLHGAAFSALTAVLFAAYFLAFPDGSLVHASYLSLDPRVWAERCIRHVHWFAEYVTFRQIMGVGKLLPLGVALGLMAWGLVRRPWDGSVLAIYCLLHLALLTMFRYDGGVRYYHPVLPAAFVLLAMGCEAAWDVVRSRWGGDGQSGMPAIAAWSGSLLLLALMLPFVRMEQSRYERKGIADPDSPSTVQTLAWVAANAPPRARIAFYKPRAFRLLSGRMAFAIAKPASLAGVDWYVFSAAAEDARMQIPEAALQEASAGFKVIFERLPYRVYAKTGPLAKTMLPQRGVQ